MENAIKAAKKLRRWRKYPTSFVLENFHVVPDEWQKDALEAFVSEDPEKQKIALSACAGPGKSAAIAWCALLFISCYCGKGEHPLGAVISATKDTLMDTLWPEIAKWMQRSEYLKKTFTWTKSRVYNNDFPETWYLTARSYSKTANEDEQGRTLSGLHSDYIAYFIDESGDMGVNVVKSAYQGLSKCVFGKIITAGNPTSHSGLLYHVVEEMEDWFVITISGDPEDPKRSPRIDIGQAQKMIDAYGRDDSWVMAYILGKFPKGGINTLLTPDEVRAAIDRGKQSALNTGIYDRSQKRLGIDVALHGDDKTIIFPRQGLRAFKCVELRDTASDGEAPARIAARTLQAKATWGSEMEFIDTTGVGGAGVVNYCIDGGGDPISVNYASKAADSRYFNKRAEMYFRLQKWVRSGGILPNDKDLIKELSAPTYSLKNGKIILEPKEKIKARLKRSPDKADALAQTFYMSDMPAGINSLIAGWDSLNLNNNVKQSSDWDPYD